jgi:hypothetical protein
MLGALIDSLDNPNVAAKLVAALDDAAISERLAIAAQSMDCPQCDVLAARLRGFVETASDDLWVQLIGIMNRAEDPGLAAVRAILGKVLPELAP